MLHSHRRSRNIVTPFVASIIIVLFSMWYTLLLNIRFALMCARRCTQHTLTRSESNTLCVKRNNFCVDLHRNVFYGACKLRIPVCTEGCSTFFHCEIKWFRQNCSTWPDNDIDRSSPEFSAIICIFMIGEFSPIIEHRRDRMHFRIIGRDTTHWMCQYRSIADFI